MEVDGAQTKEDAIQETGQTSQKEDSPSLETFYKGVGDFAEAYANQKHSKLDSMVAERDKYLFLADFELKEHREKVDKLQTEYDDLLSKGEGGADIAKLKKQIAEEQIALRKEKDAFAFEKAGIEEEAKKLHTVRLADHIRELCNSKVEDPELRKTLIANVTELNPTTKEQVEKYVTMMNVSPPVKTPEATVIGSSGGNRVPTGSPMELARQAYSKQK